MITTKEQVMSQKAGMSGAEIDTLVALVEQGPLWDGDIPSKAGRTDLFDRGYAVRVIVAGNDGYTAATYAGRDAYTAHFGTSLGGGADTIAEARASRLTRNVVRRAGRAS